MGACGLIIAARRAACALMLAAAFAASSLTGGAALANPSLDDTIQFTRSELSALCVDPRRSRIDPVDRIAISAGRSCQVTLGPQRLGINIRQRGAAQHGGAYARMTLDVRFSRESGFICGPENAAGDATLFVSCEIDRATGGSECASRDLSIAHPTGGTYETTQRLSAASILRTDAESCGVVSRALTYISSRARPAQSDDLRAFFAQ
ncbi:MAG: hypothetical protein AAF909_05145 [Pseudomonadota bacterium]